MSPPEALHVLQHYFRGRGHPLWHVLLWSGVMVAGIPLWDASVDVPGSSNGAVISARLTLPFLGALASAWLLTPDMASWEALAQPRPRRLSAAAAAVTIATSVLALVSAVLLPDVATRDGADGFFAGAEDVTPILGPLIHNMIVLASIAFLSVATLGRPAGTAAAIVAYYLLVVTGADSRWYHVIPYYSHAFGIPVTNHPVAAAFLSITAIVVWRRTGGCGGLARRLDPRR